VNRPIEKPGLWKNFIETTNLNSAIRFNKKLKLKYRQIDVTTYGRNRKRFVLKNSWL
jgi:hypothetical protein